MFFSNLEFRLFKHDMPCASEEIIMAEVRRHTSEYVFHGANSILYKAHLMAEISLKVTNVFRSENLALFTVTSIHCIRKSTKKEAPKLDEIQNGKQHKIQGSNRSKDWEIELIEVWWKRKRVQ